MTDTNKSSDWIGVFIIEVLMFCTQVFLIKTMINGALNKNPTLEFNLNIHSIEDLGGLIVFLIIPIFLCVFTLWSIFFQIIKNSLYGLLFGLIVVASLVLVFSWLMHGIPLYSFLLSLVSFSLCSFGFTKMWRSKKIKSAI